MSEYLIEAAGLLLRWLHVIAAIAWIGESFYFVALDRGLKPSTSNVPGLHGESWSVHGGGFYLKQKFLPAPAQLPDDLHWSKWKSYTTWLSGFALFTVLYLLSPQLYLIDPSVAALSPTQGVLLALAFPLGGWLVYDGMCRLVGFRDGMLGALVGVFVLALCIAATQLFAGRAAFLLVGATLGTIMSANVFFLIIPGQKRMVAALGVGATPNPLDGARGKQRSVHNTYFTLPVVFAMLATHYATAFAHPHSWAVLAIFMAAGALIRQFFVLWHSGDRAWGLLVGAGLLLLAVFVAMAPTPRAPSSDVDPAALSTPNASLPLTGEAAAIGSDSASVLAITQQRCAACHATRPTLMASAPKGAVFETVEQIETHAALLHRQVIELKVMPPGNVTGLTDAERAAIHKWYLQRSESTNAQ